MMGYGGMGWGGMGWLGMIGMILLWVILIAAIVWGVSRLLPARRTGQAYEQPRQETAEEILDRRFARGEIDAETYQSLRATLAASRGEGRR